MKSRTMTRSDISEKNWVRGVETKKAGMKVNKEVVIVVKKNVETENTTKVRTERALEV